MKETVMKNTLIIALVFGAIGTAFADFTCSVKVAEGEVGSSRIASKDASAVSGSLIMNESDWIRISQSDERKTATYSLGADITLTCTMSYLGDFAGTINGNGHKLTLGGEFLDYALYSDHQKALTEAHADYEHHQATSVLLSTGSRATITDVAFGNGRIATTLIGCTFKNCTSTYSGSAFGAFLDKATDCTFENCRATVSITTDGNTFGNGVGGLVGGANNCTFVDCTTIGTVSGDDHVGGLVGNTQNGSIFRNCHSICSVRGNQIVGGLFGALDDGTAYNPCKISNCSASGDVQGGGWAGGFCGSVDNCLLSNCSACGSVSEGADLAVDTAAYDRFGGFAGSVTEGSSGGGVFRNCKASGAVSARQSKNVGGFAGLINGNHKARTSLIQVVAEGAVEGAHLVGGFTGDTSDSDFTDCAAYGSVSAYGNASGQCGVGSFTGSYGNKSTWTRCYAAGKVDPKIDGYYVYTGGIMPYNMPESMVPMMESLMKLPCTNCYWNTTTTGQRYSAVGEGLTSVIAGKTASYSGWDFSDVWTIAEGHPRLVHVFSCVEVLPDDPGTDPDPCDGAVLSVTPQTVRFGAEGGTVDLRVTSTHDWRTSITDEEGNPVSALTAAADSNRHTLTVAPNETCEERRWTVCYMTDCATFEVAVVQDARQPSISVDPGIVSLACDGETKTVTLKASGAWTMTQTEGASTCSVSPSSGVGDAILRVTAGKSTERCGVRSWAFSFALDDKTCGEYSAGLTVSQTCDDGGCSISLDKPLVVFGACELQSGCTYADESEIVTVTSTAAWSAEVDGCAGLSVQKSGSAGTTKVTIRPDPNFTGAERSWTITFKAHGTCGDCQTSMIVRQPACAACCLTLDGKDSVSKHIGAYGSLRLVRVDSATDWAIDENTIPDWVKFYRKSGTAGTWILVFRIRPVDYCDELSESSRSACIVFRSTKDDCDAAAKLNIDQTVPVCGCSYLNVFHGTDERYSWTTNLVEFTLPLHVRSSAEWTAESDSEWLIATQVTDSQLTLEVRATSVDRKGTVTLSNDDGIVRTFDVIQTKETLCVEPNEALVTAKGGTMTLKVSCSASWSLSIPEDCRDWIRTDVTSGVGDGDVQIMVDPSSEADERVCELEFVSGVVGRICEILQLPGSAKIVISGPERFTDDESASFTCDLFRPDGDSEEVSPVWSVQPADAATITATGELSATEPLFELTEVTVVATMTDSDGSVHTSEKTVLIDPAPGPGVWLTDVETALEQAVKSAKLVVVLGSNPVSCPYCKTFEPIARHYEFLRWARDNDVWLINAYTSDVCGDGVIDSYFYELVRGADGYDGKIEYPTLAVVRPSDLYHAIGVDVARTGRTIGEVEYDGTVQSLIAGIDSYLTDPEESDPMTVGEALGVPEVEWKAYDSANWGYELSLDRDWTWDGVCSVKTDAKAFKNEHSCGIWIYTSGPRRIRFRYSKSYSAGKFYVYADVDDELQYIYRDTIPGIRTDWQTVTADLPSGTRAVHIWVTPGDYSKNRDNAYNGIWIDGLEFESVEQDSENPSEAIQDETILFASGWNWIALNVTPTNAAVGAVLAGGAFADEDVIKSAEGSATYYGGKWYGELTSIKPGVAYMVKKSTAGTTTLTVSGEAAATSVDVLSGWNWIGSTATEEIALDALTHSGGFTDEDVIKSADASATYYGGKWYGELKSLAPGVGYKAKFAKGGTLTFFK